jgi:general secretion pathway protein K
MFDDGTLDLQIEDHGGRLQVNALISPQGGTVDAEQRNRFYRLFTTAEIGLSPDQAEHILDALTDWLDEDDAINGFGAENSWYQTQDPPYTCKNGPISSIDELTLVRGITPELLYGSNTRPGLAQLLTPYGVDGNININTAPPLVLRTLSEGLDQTLVDALLAYRADMSHDLAQTDWYKSVAPELTLARTTVSSLYFGVRVKASLRTATIQALAVVLRQPPASPQGQVPPPFIISWQVE